MSPARPWLVQSGCTSAARPLLSRHVRLKTTACAAVDPVRSSIDELEALKRENEQLRVRIRQIRARTPGKHFFSSPGNVVLNRAKLFLHRAAHAGDEAQLLETSGTEDAVVAPEINGAEARSQAMPPPQHPPPAKSELRTVDADLQHPLTAPEPLKSVLLGVSARPLETGRVPGDQDGAAQPGPDAPNGTVTTKTKTTPESLNVQSAERLGMYQEPSSSFPAYLPSDSADAVGPTPNLIIDTHGLQRRVPNRAVDLIEEMEEADLKNPSDALLVCSSAHINHVAVPMHNTVTAQCHPAPDAGPQRTHPTRG